MPVISFSSPKGGAGKTTAATLLATELAGRGVAVGVIDANPNENALDWASLPGKPASSRAAAELRHRVRDDADDRGAPRGWRRSC